MEKCASSNRVLLRVSRAHTANFKEFVMWLNKGDAFSLCGGGDKTKEGENAEMKGLSRAGRFHAPRGNTNTHKVKNASRKYRNAVKGIKR